MYKVEYLRRKKDNNFSMDFTYRSETKYTFSTDIERIENMIDWLFNNTRGRFFVLGTDTIYFENEEDAMAFKLGWI